MGDRLSGRVRELLQTHQPRPLPESVRGDLTRLTGEADTRAKLVVG